MPTWQPHKQKLGFNNYVTRHLLQDNDWFRALPRAITYRDEGKVSWTKAGHYPVVNTKCQIHFCKTKIANKK